MVDVAQLVRVPDCDSGCCRFESGHPPESPASHRGIFFDFFDKGGGRLPLIAAPASSS